MIKVYEWCAENYNQIQWTGTVVFMVIMVTALLY